MFLSMHHASKPKKDVATMTTEDDPRKEILLENLSALSRFESEGVDLKKKVEFEFGVSTNSKNDSVKIRSNYREQFSTPKGGLFIVVDDPDDYRLLLSIEMIPDAENITEIEWNLCIAAEKVEGAKVFWEFKG